MKKTLIYISSCALNQDRTPGVFLLQELPWLRRHFDRVIVCDKNGIAQISEDRPETIPVSHPPQAVLRAIVQALCFSPFWAECKRLAADGKLSIRSALKLFAFTMRGFKLYHWSLPLMYPGEQTTVYAYWMSYDGFAAALCKKRYPQMRAMARAHAFDIDVSRNPLNPYLLKRWTVEQLDRVYPISNHAREQIESYAGEYPEKLRVIGVGSAGNALSEPLDAPRFSDGVIRVVSCSAMVDVKQLPLLIDTLAAWTDSSLHWLHIGGGEQEVAIRAYAQKVLGGHQNVSFSFAGSVKPEQVLAFYRSQAFDVFLNTSRNEGTPVSIMEALQAGIPVVAPCVGGIAELVDSSVGRLYKQNGETDTILEALCSVIHVSREETRRMRAAAQARWKERCALEALLPQLFAEEAEER